MDFLWLPPAGCQAGCQCLQLHPGSMHAHGARSTREILAPLRYSSQHSAYCTLYNILTAARARNNARRCNCATNKQLCVHVPRADIDGRALLVSRSPAPPLASGDTERLPLRLVLECKGNLSGASPLRPRGRHTCGRADTAHLCGALRPASISLASLAHVARSRRPEGGWRRDLLHVRDPRRWSRGWQPSARCA